MIEHETTCTCSEILEARGRSSAADVAAAPPRRRPCFQGRGVPMMLCLVGMLVGCAHNHAPVLTQSASQRAECARFVARLPVGTTRDYIDVPEDWSHPRGRRLRVFYYGRFSGQVPIAIFNGGPSASSHELYDMLQSTDGARSAPLLFIDQRGTGCSAPYPATDDLASLSRIERYGSRAIVEDAEAIRRRLLGFDGRWKVVGASFGGLIVQRYVALHPEHLLRAASHGWSVADEPGRWMRQRLESQARVLEAYLKVYPGDDERLKALAARIPDDRCWRAADAVQLCGRGVLGGMNMTDLGKRNRWDRMHSTITALSESTLGAGGVLDRFVQLAVSPLYVSSYLVRAALTRLEMMPGSTSPDACRVAVESLRRAGSNPEAMAVNECRLYLEAIHDPAGAALLSRLRIIDPLRSQDIRRGLERNRSLQLFLYASTFDSVVPVETFNDEVAALGDRITYRVLPHSGHEGLRNEPQIWLDLLQ